MAKIANFAVHAIICIVLMGSQQKEAVATVCEDVPSVPNTQEIGRTVQYECAEGFIEETNADMSATCNYPQGNWDTSNVICKPKLAANCWELKTEHNISEDGVYVVSSPDGGNMSVRCDMTTDGGGWTIFQRRGDGSVGFNNNFEVYKSFFGSLSGEFWMGNDFNYEFTRDVQQTLRVDLCNFNGETSWAKYEQFSIGPASDNYRLQVANYNGHAGDPLIEGTENGHHTHNGFIFLAPSLDTDQDLCQNYYHSGWWFNDCFAANLNGVYHQQSTASNTDMGIMWNTWIDFQSLSGSEMKMRPSTAISTTQEPFTCPVI